MSPAEARQLWNEATSTADLHERDGLLKRAQALGAGHPVASVILEAYAHEKRALERERAELDRLELERAAVREAARARRRRPLEQLQHTLAQLLGHALDRALNPGLFEALSMRTMQLRPRAALEALA
jgi:hypothetical protein